MPNRLTLVSAGSEPLTVAEARAHLWLDSTSYDTLLTTMISAAREYLEEVTSRTLTLATWDYTLAGFPAGVAPIYLPRPPARALTSVTYVDASGTSQALSGVQFTASTEPALLLPARNTVWPVVAIGHVAPVVIRYTAGYTALPARVGLAMRLLVSHLFENREATTQQALTAIPYGLGGFIRTLAWGRYA